MLTPPPQHIPVLKIFLDIYVDDFGTYRNVYHSLGANFNDFIQPVLQDIKRLEKGFIMQTLNGNAFVIGSIGCVTAALPQGNDIADWTTPSNTSGSISLYGWKLKARTLLEVTFNIFNTNGENAFIENWKNIEKPSNWYQMPNPVRYHQSLEQLEYGTKYKTKFSCIEFMFSTCWAIEAKVLKLAFSNTMMTENVYQELQ
ncbi:hypothetical protein C1646_762261 [Rhizophagus diaphanus]|nr:hypothetical protein C1646_762261 [Rhizophagus diaphanus] [Rhizophagus sp. MUCL 43196]